MDIYRDWCELVFNGHAHYTLNGMYNSMLCSANMFILHTYNCELYQYLKSLCGYLPVCSGGGVTVGGCGVEGVSGRVELEGGRGNGYGGDAVMAVGKYEEGTRVGLGVTCEYTVVGVAVLAASDG